MNKKFKCEVYLTDDCHLHIQDGNKKVGKGIYTINTLAGDEPLTKKDGTKLVNVSGTCAGCCKECKSDCYAIKNQTFRSSKENLRSWGENTVLATQDIESYFNEIQLFINRSIVCAIRYHAFGEIPSYEYLCKMVELANANERVQFYTYSKRFEWIEKYVAENGEFPSNLVINVSIWHKNYKNPLMFPEFIYDDGTEEYVANIPHCPAVDKNGHETGVTCASCKRCLFAKNGMKTAVYAH